MSKSATPLPKAAKPVAFEMLPDGPPVIGKGQRWMAKITEEGAASPDLFPVVCLYAISGNAAANLIDMMRVAVRAELDARGLGGRRIPKKR